MEQRPVRKVLQIEGRTCTREVPMLSLKPRISLS